MMDQDIVKPLFDPHYLPGMDLDIHRLSLGAA